MGTDNLVFLEVLEWFDDSGRTVAHRIPEKGSGEIKFGAQLTVRESQAAVFFSEGTACDALGPGRHTLTTKNLPVLNKIMAIPWGMRSPFRAEVYFVNLKDFVNLAWGTRDPVAFRDSELGLVRLRAHGVLNVQVVQPVLFVNSLVGTKVSYDIGDLESYLAQVVVSRLNDLLGEKLDTLLNLPALYDEIAGGLKEKLTADFSRYGLALKTLYINAITPPDEVQKAIDERARLGAIGGRLDDLLKMKMAMALEKGAGEGGAQAGGMGMGLGMGMGMVVPGLFGGMLSGEKQKAPEQAVCPDCGGEVSREARFCCHCGSQIVVMKKCAECGKNISPRAKFCPACGVPTSTPRHGTKCSQCGAENLMESSFCNQCGQSLR